MCHPFYYFFMPVCSMQNNDKAEITNVRLWVWFYDMQIFCIHGESWMSIFDIQKGYCDYEGFYLYTIYVIGVHELDMMPNASSFPINLLNLYMVVNKLWNILLCIFLFLSKWRPIRTWFPYTIAINHTWCWCHVA